MEYSRGLACLGLPQSDGFPREDSPLLKLCTGSISTRRKLGVNSGDEINGIGSSGSATPRLGVRPSEGRGSGLFTLDSIPAYSRIMSEDSLLSLGKGEDLPELWEKYCALPVEHQAEFDALTCPQVRIDQERGLSARLRLRGYEAAEADKMARVGSKYHANAFKTGPNFGLPGSHHWSNCLAVKVARINHSCAPNAIESYRINGCHAVYALRDIEAGGEIEIAYFDPTMPFSMRQSRAQDWGFTCTCQVCRNNRLSKWDKYERQLAFVRWNESSRFHNVRTIDQINSCQKAIDTALDPEYPWLRSALCKLYTALFQLECQRHGNLGDLESDSRVYLRTILMRSIEWLEKTTGIDSAESDQRRELLREFDVLTEIYEHPSQSTGPRDPRWQRLQWITNG